MRCCNRMIYFIVHYKQQWQQQTFLRSTHCVSITMTATFSCQIILQKSTTVFCRQPCAAMYLWMPSASCSVHYTPTYHQYRHRSGLGIHSKSQTDCGLMKHGVCHGVLNCVSKNDTTHPPSIILTVVVRFLKFLVQIFLREYANERWFIFSPHLLSIRSLHWETFGTWKSQVSSKTFFGGISKIIIFYLAMIFFCFHEKLITSALTSNDLLSVSVPLNLFRLWF